MAKVLRFPSSSPARFTALQSALSEKGLDLDADQGQVKKFGAEVFYVYADDTLTITVNSPPHFHSMDSFCDELANISQ